MNDSHNVPGGLRLPKWPSAPLPITSSAASCDVSHKAGGHMLGEERGQSQAWNFGGCFISFFLEFVCLRVAAPDPMLPVSILGCVIIICIRGTVGEKRDG